MKKLLFTILIFTLLTGCSQTYKLAEKDQWISHKNDEDICQLIQNYTTGVDTTLSHKVVAEEDTKYVKHIQFYSNDKLFLTFNREIYQKFRYCIEWAYPGCCAEYNYLTRELDDFGFYKVLASKYRIGNRYWDDKYIPSVLYFDTELPLEFEQDKIKDIQLRKKK